MLGCNRQGLTTQQREETSGKGRESLLLPKTQPQPLHSIAPGPISHPSVRVVPWACGAARGSSRIYGIKGRAGRPAATTGQLWVSAYCSSQGPTHRGPAERGETTSEAKQAQTPLAPSPRACSQGVTALIAPLPRGSEAQLRSV